MTSAVVKAVCKQVRSINDTFKKIEEIKLVINVWETEKKIQWMQAGQKLFNSGFESQMLKYYQLKIFISARAAIQYTILKQF